jgi:GxxExxY protein
MEHRAAEPQSPEKEEINKLSYAVIGAAIEVHRALGPGFLESVYEEAMAIELALRSLRFDRQQRVPIMYKEKLVGEHVLDLVIEGALVVELKAIEQLAAVHFAQIHAYLKASELEFGLLINFNVPVLTDGVRRVIARGGAEGANLFSS